MSTITTKDGTQIYYKDWGSGPVVTFSHGWPLNADMWDGQMLFLAQNGFRVVAHDRRGHGRSSQASSGNDMDGYADDLAAVIDALDLKQVTLVGHSTPVDLGRCCTQLDAFHRALQRGRDRLGHDGHRARLGGWGYRALTAAQVAAIVEAFPRLEMKQRFTRAVCRIVETRPATTYDNFARDFGERFVPDYKPVSTVDYLRNSPFEE